MLIRVHTVELEARGLCGEVESISEFHSGVLCERPRPLCLKSDYVKDCKRSKKSKKKQKRRRHEGEKRRKRKKGCKALRAVKKVGEKTHNSRRLVLIQH